MHKESMEMAVVDAAGEAGREVASIGHDVGKLWSAKRGGSEQKKAVMNHGLSQDIWWRRRETHGLINQFLIFISARNAPENTPALCVMK